MDRKKRNIHRKGTDPAFRTGKIKKYKRAKPENKEMTDKKIQFPLFAYKKKEDKPQAVPGHGEGGGVSRRKGQVGADTKFLQKKDVCLRQTF